MNNQISLEESMPNATIAQSVGVLLIKLGVRYGKILNLSDFYPQYKNIHMVPPPAVKKMYEELSKEFLAADTLGELAKGSYTLGEKLTQYKNVVNKLLAESSAEELAKPILWENAKRLIGKSIAAGNGAQIAPTENEALFLLFKAAYPKKANMGRAEKWFKAHKPNRLTVEKMLFAIENQKNTLTWEKENGQYIPNPYTWLNAKAWENEVTCDECANNSSGILQKAISRVPTYKSKMEVT